jgi:L-alanine-DL-glutamate epimerase-like enolase superfamily enzyme
LQITRVEPFILHVPVTGSQIADSTHSITHWGVVGARIDTDTGLSGYGFTGTHAHLSGDQLITRCIATCHAPLLLGEEPRDVQRLWLKLARNPALQWIGRAGITTLAQAAIDVALWDLKAKRAGLSLAKLLGAHRESVRCYNTSGGFLHTPTEQLLVNAAASRERGIGGIKLKVGQPDGSIDVKRVEAVRKHLGDAVPLMVDANQQWDRPTAQRMCRIFEQFNLVWI